MNLKREGANHGILEDLDNRNDNWGTLEQELDERYTKTESDTRFAPKQHTHEISDVDGLSDELDRGRITLVNLVENGDFSDGLNGWGHYGKKAEWVNGRAYFKRIASGDSNLVTLQKTSEQTENIGIGRWYVFAKVDIVSIGVPKRFFILNNGGVDNQIFDLGDSVGEKILTKVVDTSLLGVLYINTAVGDEFYLDYIGVLNLTQTFGAGNEPTKQEMDKLIETLGVEYFEEITVTKLDIINWQLALIRQNTQAIIALGGTIV